MNTPLAAGATAVRVGGPLPARSTTPPDARGQWMRFTALGIITLLFLVPILGVFALSLQPPLGAPADAGPFSSFAYVFGETLTPQWLANSLGVTLATVTVSILVAAPAGYVVSRGRGKLIETYSLLLFVIQSLPIIVAVIPLFILFANLGFVDSLTAIVIIYVGESLAVSTWMMAAYFDTIPITLEEAAWVDGCSVFGSFIRIVMANSLPGILSMAIFSFLRAWNDYLIAVVFLRSLDNLTLPVGLQSFFQQNATDWGPVMAASVIILLPPLLVFTFLNKFFSIGGIGGALAGD